MTPSRRAALALLLATGLAAAHAAPASAPRAARGAMPAANFLVEWRIQPTRTAAANGGVVIGTRDAATGTSGFGAGATVVGTARAQAPQAVRVANGKEAAIVFDRASRQAVYDMAWSADSQAESASAAARSHAQGVAGHEVVMHRVDGLRVTPHWTHGDTLSLDLELTHAGAAPDADANARATRDIDFRSTLQLSFDEWQGVARVGEGGDELQVRVSWR